MHFGKHILVLFLFSPSVYGKAPPNRILDLELAPKTLTFKKGGVATINLKGRLPPGLSIAFDGNPVTPSVEGEFEASLPVEYQSESCRVNINDSKGDTYKGSLHYFWKKRPPLLRLKVRKEGEKDIPLSFDIEGTYPLDDWIALTWIAPEASRYFSNLNWYSFVEIGLDNYLPQTGGNSVAPYVAWTPIWKFGPGDSNSFAFVGNVGLTLIKYNISSRFVGIQFGPSISYFLLPWHFGVGPQVYYWTNHLVWQWGFFPQVAYEFKERWLNFIDSLHIKYGYIFGKESTIHQLQLGVGISL